VLVASWARTQFVNLVTAWNLSPRVKGDPHSFPVNHAQNTDWLSQKVDALGALGTTLLRARANTIGCQCDCSSTTEPDEMERTCPFCLRMGNPNPGRDTIAHLMLRCPYHALAKERAPWLALMPSISKSHMDRWAGCANLAQQSNLILSVFHLEASRLALKVLNTAMTLRGSPPPISSLIVSCSDDEPKNACNK
jgi:hypothetical protein